MNLGTTSNVSVRHVWHLDAIPGLYHYHKLPFRQCNCFKECALKARQLGSLVGQRNFLANAPFRTVS